jgi:VIT1/CCC1 family predicted Fe2+/Mn2+ transporter
VVVTEWLTVGFGVLLFAAPWVLTYTDRVGASWTSWVVGAIGVVLGVITTVSSGNRPHRPAIQP